MATRLKEREIEFKPGEKEVMSRGKKRPLNSERVEFKLGEKEIVSRALAEEHFLT